MPFGGVRLMLVGDVAQLPPVGDFTVELSDAGEEEGTGGHLDLRLRAICGLCASFRTSSLTIAGATTSILSWASS